MTRVWIVVGLLVACSGGKESGTTTGASGTTSGAGPGTGAGATGTGTGTVGTGTTGGTSASSCAFECHGSATSAAPPPSTSGATDPSNRGVGAHQTHMTGGAGSAPVSCDTCHQVPTGPGDVGHADTALPAEVMFTGIALTGGASPTLNDSTTCSDSYCHGGGSLSPSGGTNTEPLWTSVGTGQAACGTCHSLPPPAPHPAESACETCHTGTAGPGQTIADPSLHVNGSTDF